jgi:hypothetical protein
MVCYKASEHNVLFYGILGAGKKECGGSFRLFVKLKSFKINLKLFNN